MYADFLFKRFDFLVTLDKIDALCVVYLNIFYLYRNFDEISIKYQSYPKLAKIDVFKLRTCICHCLIVVSIEFLKVTYLSHIIMHVAI